MTMSASLVSTRVVAKTPVSKASKRTAVVASAGPVEGRRAALVAVGVRESPGFLDLSRSGRLTVVERRPLRNL